MSRFSRFLAAFRKPQPVTEATTSTVEQVVHKMTKQYVPQFRRELEHLKRARAAAEDPYYATRFFLMDVYEDNLENDAHVKAVFRKRIMNVTSQRYKITDASGEMNEEITNLFRERWFMEFLTLAMQATGFGFSLVGFDFSDGIRVICVPRRNVLPERGMIVMDASSREMDGVSFVDGDLANETILVCEDVHDLGLFNTSSPLSILKRHSFANWDAFEEIFGIPMRIMRTDSTNQRALKEKEKWLADMGTAAYAIFGHDDEIEIKESGSRDAYNVFNEKRKATNEEVSKLFLGQTMTTDNGSSNSQASIHADVEQQITSADMQRIAFLVNDELLPLLRENGIAIPDGDRFEWDTERGLDAVDRIAIDGVLLSNGIQLSREYLEKTYGVEVESLGLQFAAVAKKKRLTDSLHEQYAGLGFTAAENDFEEPDNTSVILDIIQHIWRTDGDLEQIPEEALEALAVTYTSSMVDGVLIGYGGGDMDTIDEATIKALSENVSVFSRVKAGSEYVDLTSLLLTDNELNTFSAFRKSALELHDIYNIDWLSAEYDTAINGALNSKRWNDAVRDADLFPMLQYKTAGDGRVRKDHKELDDIQLDINSAFWDTYFPPNGYRCRCDTISKATGEPTENPVTPTIPVIFRNNIGRTKVLFPPSHPYYANANKI
jgi:hypothetical protein